MTWESWTGVVLVTWAALVFYLKRYELKDWF